MLRFCGKKKKQVLLQKVPALDEGWGVPAYYQRVGGKFFKALAGQCCQNFSFSWEHRKKIAQSSCLAKEN
jgi:hypothetical protein